MDGVVGVRGEGWGSGSGGEFESTKRCNERFMNYDVALKHTIFIYLYCVYTLPSCIIREQPNIFKKMVIFHDPFGVPYEGSNPDVMVVVQ